jgi:hypothetical protein
VAGFDPALPEDHALIEAEVLRGQFTGLKALIDGINSVDAATVDSVTTIPPGDPAQASVEVVGETLHFAFDLPQGWPGSPGATGAPGPQGPPFAQAVVDGVTTLPSGSQATVDVTFDGTKVHFSFGIPEGPQGPAGEVTTDQLDASIATAVAGTSANSNTVSTVGQVADSSYNQAQMQDVINKLDQLILALRRW